eukprot:comp24342_c2_seq3/m.46321 comp24342_c2_seq3/g.46321  ORF comp24342_c2_seq3/g.46321 comp24342_c2_seq3/m.46321 type:complete len:784 (-) comp24342_c2_seq3:999-3350(-)
MYLMMGLDETDEWPGFGHHSAKEMKGAAAKMCGLVDPKTDKDVKTLVKQRDVYFQVAMYSNTEFAKAALVCDKIANITSKVRKSTSTRVPPCVSTFRSLQGLVPEDRIRIMDQFLGGNITLEELRDSIPRLFKSTRMIKAAICSHLGLEPNEYKKVLDNYNIPEDKILIHEATKIPTYQDIKDIKNTQSGVKLDPNIAWKLKNLWAKRKETSPLPTPKKVTAPTNNGTPDGHDQTPAKDTPQSSGEEPGGSPLPTGDGDHALVIAGHAGNYALLNGDYREYPPTEMASFVQLQIQQDEDLQTMKLFIADIPTGETSEHWDTAWTKDDVSKLFEWTRGVAKLQPDNEFHWTLVICSWRQALFVDEAATAAGYTTRISQLARFGRNNRSDHIFYGVLVACLWKRPGVRLTEEVKFPNIPWVLTESPIRPKDKGADKYITSTVKPISAMRYLIREFSNHGDVVFDMLGGTGSVTEAAIREQRSCVYIDSDKSLFDYAVYRAYKYADRKGGKINSDLTHGNRNLASDITLRKYDETLESEEEPVDEEKQPQFTTRATQQSQGTAGSTTHNDNSRVKPPSSTAASPQPTGPVPQHTDPSVKTPPAPPSTGRHEHPDTPLHTDERVAAKARPCVRQPPSGVMPEPDRNPMGFELYLANTRPPPVNLLREAYLQSSRESDTPQQTLSGAEGQVHPQGGTTPSPNTEESPRPQPPQHELSTQANKDPNLPPPPKATDGGTISDSEAVKGQEHGVREPDIIQESTQHHATHRVDAEYDADSPPPPLPLSMFF